MVKSKVDKGKSLTLVLFWYYIYEHSMDMDLISVVLSFYIAIPRNLHEIFGDVLAADQMMVKRNFCSKVLQYFINGLQICISDSQYILPYLMSFSS